jgi:hypothetical protein
METGRPSSFSIPRICRKPLYEREEKYIEGSEGQGAARYEASTEALAAEIRASEQLPTLGKDAYHGLAGKIALSVGERTEADSRGVLAGLLIGFGNVIGRTARFRVGNDEHYPVEFGVIVGKTGIARKGLTSNVVEAILREVDPEWVSHRIARGFSSGEGLLHYVRDPRSGMVKVSKKNEPAKFELQVVDPGVEDKRCFAVLGEFGELITMMLREGNTLSTMLRGTWDCRESLEVNTRKEPIRSTRAHVSVFGGITAQELLKLIPQLPSFDGFANRFLWVLIERSNCFASGGEPVSAYLSRELEELRAYAQKARKVPDLRRSEDAEVLWTNIYNDLASREGVLVIHRADAHCLRLQMLYALLDGSSVIEKVHVKAAFALWQYCEACTLKLFRPEGSSLDAQKILDHLREKGSEGATRTEISVRVFNRHRTQKQIVAALVELERLGLAFHKTERTDQGHKVERWFAVEQDNE